MNTDCLKFRVFHKITGDYIKPSRASLSGDGRLLIYSRDYADWSDDDDDYIIEQCTGLCDKNGKLIYEGDILSVKFKDDPEVNFTVEWEDFSMVLKRLDNKLRCSLAVCMLSDYEVKVIGNIHERN